jgi:hypothetical protein
MSLYVYGFPQGALESSSFVDESCACEQKPFFPKDVGTMHI